MERLYSSSHGCFGSLGPGDRYVRTSKFGTWEISLYLWVCSSFISAPLEVYNHKYACGRAGDLGRSIVVIIIETVCTIQDRTYRGALRRPLRDDRGEGSRNVFGRLSTATQSFADV